MTEKEFLAVVFTLEKFRPYLLGSKMVIFTDHSVLKYLMIKKETKPDWFVDPSASRIWPENSG